METVSGNYLESLIRQLLYYKGLADKAMAQVPDEALAWQYNDESNSIAIIVQHMAGNMRSRFTDFLVSDGEKPWRDRDGEFEPGDLDREALLALWESGWDCVLSAVRSLRDEDLLRMVYIRNEGHTVLEALNRQLAHYPYHVGQIVYIARMCAGEQWQTLSIARNKSASYNRQKFDREPGRRHFTEDSSS